MFSNPIPSLRSPAGRVSRGAMIAAIVAVGLTGSGAAVAASAADSAAAEELAMRCDPINPGGFRACDVEPRPPL